MKPKRRAVFLDRDGVLIEEVDYLRRTQDMRLLPGAAAAVRRLRAAGFKVVVITNQSAVARGLLTLKGLAAIHRELARRLGAKGARLDALYFCPHHPEAGRRVRCACRKPGTLLLRKAAKRFGLDLGASCFIGDTTTDLKTARNAGCRALLVRTGKGGKDGVYTAKADAVFKDLAAAARWILGRERA